MLLCSGTLSAKSKRKPSTNPPFWYFLLNFSAAVSPRRIHLFLYSPALNLAHVPLAKENPVETLYSVPVTQQQPDKLLNL